MYIKQFHEIIYLGGQHFEWKLIYVNILYMQINALLITMI